MRYKNIISYLKYLLNKYFNIDTENKNLSLYLKLIKDGLNKLCDYNEKNILQIM